MNEIVKGLLIGSLAVIGLVGSEVVTIYFTEK